MPDELYIVFAELRLERGGPERFNCWKSRKRFGFGMKVLAADERGAAEAAGCGTMRYGQLCNLVQVGGVLELGEESSQF